MGGPLQQCRSDLQYGVVGRTTANGRAWKIERIPPVNTVSGSVIRVAGQSSFFYRIVVIACVNDMVKSARRVARARARVRRAVGRTPVAEALCHLYVKLS